jgi:hypothetical protein
MYVRKEPTMPGKTVDGVLSTTLPLAQYLREAVSRSQREMPDAEGCDKFRTRLFGFVRFTKARPELRDMSPEEALRAVMTTLGVDHHGWSDLFPESDDPAVEFTETWDKVRLAAGQDALKTAIANADRLPLKLPDPISTNYQRFVSIAGHLQRLFPNSSIYLPEELLAQELGCTPRTVGYYRSRAVKDGYLRLVKPHHWRSHKATQFQFALHRFNWDTGEEDSEDSWDSGQETPDEKDIPL